MKTAALALCLLTTSAALAQAPQPSAASLEQPAGIVDAFHTALDRGDTVAALSFLADDALIFEEGGVERGKAEYAAHHLAADAAFSKAVPSKMLRRSGGAEGDVAWVVSEGRTTGTFKDRPVDRHTAETMLLRREGDTWRIAHIHWSSRDARP